MFAHNVIDDLEKNKRYLYEDEVDMFKNLIRSSQKFHMGDAYSIFSMYGWVLEKLGRVDDWMRKLFEEDFMDLPYPLSWFEFDESVRGSNSINKFGILMAQSSPKEHIEMFPFVFTSIGFEQKIWIPYGIYWRIWYGKDYKVGYGIHPAIKEEDVEEDDIIKLGLGGLAVYAAGASLAVKLLNCRNISTEKHYPPEKLNKKRIKHHKQPLFTYHTLVLNPVGKKQESIPSHLWNNRIHLCRGHFKTYTEDKPLFGHITGRFWWQPAVRGRNRDGVVMKDYKLAGGAS